MAKAKEAETSDWTEEALLESFGRGEFHVYSQASPELRARHDLALAAVSGNGLLLGETSEELRASKDIVLAAVRQCGTAIGRASPELCRDRDIILEAVAWSGRMADQLKEDGDVLMSRMTWISCNHVLKLALDSAGEELRTSADFIMEAVQRCGLALQYAPKNFQNDREMVGLAVRQNGLALKFASEDLQGDWDIVLQAVRCKRGSDRFGRPANLGKDPDFRLAVDSHLASEGEAAPVLSITLEEATAKGSHCLCTATMLSGSTWTLELPWKTKLEDLAKQLCDEVAKLPNQPEVVPRLFLSLQCADFLGILSPTRASHSLASVFRAA